MAGLYRRCRKGLAKPGPQTSPGKLGELGTVQISVVVDASWCQHRFQMVLEALRHVV